MKNFGNHENWLAMGQGCHPMPAPHPLPVAQLKVGAGGPCHLHGAMAPCSPAPGQWGVGLLLATAQPANKLGHQQGGACSCKLGGRWVCGGLLLFQCNSIDGWGWGWGAHAKLPCTAPKPNLPTRTPLPCPAQPQSGWFHCSTTQ